MIVHLNKSPKNPSRAVVIGANGFVGNSITEELAKQKIETLGLGRPELDLLNEDSATELRRVLKGGDVLIIAAAKAPVRDFAMFLDNLKMLHPIILAAHKVSLSHIIYISSDAVYSDSIDPLVEESETNPLSEYASSKLLGEEYLKDSNSIIFRLGTLFGISDQFSRVRLDLVVNILTAKALMEKKISVFGGDQWRPLLHVKDVANAIDQTVDTSLNGIYNLHYKNYKIIDIAEKIKEKIGDVEIDITPMSFEDARNYQVSSEKLEGESKFKAEIGLEQGIDEIYELILNNRIKDINDPRYSNQNFLKEHGVS